MKILGLDWVIWHITNKCNLFCTYCFTDSSPTSQGALELDDLLHIAEDINSSRAKLVTIIGGEPFMLPALPVVVERLLEVPDREINIDTNGTYLKTHWSDVYERVHRINVSIDDVAKDTHNMQRGGYKGVIDAIFFLREKNIPFGGNITITNKNFNTIYRTAEFLLENNASVISFSRVKPIGRGVDLYELVKLNAEQERIAISGILEFYKRHHNDTKIMVSGFYDKRLFEEGAINKLPSCLCGDVKVTIDYDGFVYPCESMPYLYSRKTVDSLFGEPVNLRQSTLGQAMGSSLMCKWREIVYEKPEDCRGCTYQLYCNSGCRAFNYYVRKQSNLRDINCQLSNLNRNMHERQTHTP